MDRLVYVKIEVFIMHLRRDFYRAYSYNNAFLADKLPLFRLVFEKVLHKEKI